MQPAQDLVYKTLESLTGVPESKGILRNSNRPKGVVIAVLGISSDATGIWWYARMRSSLENMVAP